VATIYSLWDVETGTSLGTYTTEEEVLAVIRELLRANDPDYADALDLGFQDEFGHWTAVATGRELAERATALSELPTG